MPRNSAESLSVTTVSIPLRPKPPEDLSSYAQKIWKDVVDTKPPEWFESDSFPFLRAYCQAADEHKKLADEIQTYRTTRDEGYKDTISMMTSQAKLLGELAVKMRLTQQSRYTPQAAQTANKKTASGKKTWEA